MNTLNSFNDYVTVAAIYPQNGSVIVAQIRQCIAHKFPVPIDVHEIGDATFRIFKLRVPSIFADTHQTARAIKAIADQLDGQYRIEPIARGASHTPLQVI